MLNKEIKTRFLNTEYTNVDTIKNTWYLFEKIGIMEEQYNTDLYNFNMNQLQDMLRLLDSTSSNAITKDWSIFDRYIQWCTGEGYCTPNLAAMNIFKQDLRQFINKDAQKNKYIKNRDEYHQMLEEIYNPQDQVILTLRYEGLGGRNKQPYCYEEIQNLTRNDIDFDTNELSLWRDIDNKNDINERKIVITDQKSIDVIRNAMEENIYYKGNGSTTAKVKTYNILESEYVVRQVERSDNTDKIGIMTINGRINKIKKWTGKYFLNSKSIWYSGMFDRLQNIEKGRNLTQKDYEDVYVLYGMEKSRWRALKDKYLDFLNNLEK